MAERHRKIAKSLIILALLFMIPASLAATNDMNIVPLSSPLYGYMDALYSLEGHAAPQGARPWNEADFRQQLDRIVPTNEASQMLYDRILDHLGDEDGSVHVGWNMTLQPAFAYHTDPDGFDTSDKWRAQVLNDKLLSLDFGLFVSDWFAADFGASLGFTNSATSRYNASSDAFIADSDNEARFRDSYATNILFVSSGAIDVDVTDHSFVSVGNPYISASLGRGQLSWGNGAMGNLMLGNTLPYHDYFSISASNNTWFDYTMLMSFYTHPQNYTHGFDEAPNKGIQMFLAHRFEFRMFSDRLRLTLNEAVMYQSQDNTIDFRIFNPLLIMHGYYIPANANSLATLELEFAPTKTLQMYFSFAIDDIAVGEAKAPQDNATLNMWGLMGGIRITKPVHKAYLNLNLEAVYTSPFMYHKDSYGSAPYSQDFVGSVRFNMGKNYLRRYLSFPFGSDAFAIQAEATYAVPFRYELGASLLAMMHGVTDENSIAKKYGDDTSDYVPGFLATQNPFDSSESGLISFTLDFGLEAKYYFLDNLSLGATMDMIFIHNMDNRKGDGFDIQLTVALKYSIF